MDFLAEISDEVLPEADNPVIKDGDLDASFRHLNFILGEDKEKRVARQEHCQMAILYAAALRFMDTFKMGDDYEHGGYVEAVAAANRFVHPFGDYEGLPADLTAHFKQYVAIASAIETPQTADAWQEWIRKGRCLIKRELRRAHDILARLNPYASIAIEYAQSVRDLYSIQYKNIFPISRNSAELAEIRAMGDKLRDRKFAVGHVDHSYVPVGNMRFADAAKFIRRAYESMYIGEMQDVVETALTAYSILYGVKYRTGRYRGGRGAITISD